MQELSIQKSVQPSKNVKKISDNAQQIINKRYSIKDENGQPTETWGDITHRVVNHVAQAETSIYERGTFINNLTSLIGDRIFLPNTPCLVNAGKRNAQLAGCFVLGVEDSIKGIMKTASDAAVIHQSGGGTGFTFENLRPANSLVNSTRGIASGPVSFMEIFDKVTDVVKQGGVRRGANMGIMRCDHPDILRFIHAKNNQHALTNFNISVTITDEFMKAVEKKEWIQTKFNKNDWNQPVYDPLTGKDYVYEDVTMEKGGMVYAPDVWNRIIESAHKYAEPGVIFIDTVNKHNLLKSLGPIKSCNPCAEQNLHENNSCNLGSIDVAKFYKSNWNGSNSIDWKPESNFDWGSFKQAIYWSVRFLDNVIDTCDWPLPDIDNVVKKTRPVGLGIMGFADLLLKLKIKYGSEDSLRFMETLMSAFQRDAWRASCLIGKEKGAFPEYVNNKETYDNFLWNEMGFDDLNLYNLSNIEEIKKDFHSGHFYPRNYEVTTIAPTGTISLVAETSSGIEPNFAWHYKRVDTVGERNYVHPLVVDFFDIKFDDVVDEKSATILANAWDKQLPDYFVTAHDLSAEQHVVMLASAQKYVDNGVSKTCNGHSNDTVESVRKLYELAHELGVKSVSYYRDGSRENQVLTQVCTECNTPLQIKDGCQTCNNCGFGKCTL